MHEGGLCLETKSRARPKPRSGILGISCSPRGKPGPVGQTTSLLECAKIVRHLAYFSCAPGAAANTQPAGWLNPQACHNLTDRKEAWRRRRPNCMNVRAAPLSRRCEVRVQTSAPLAGHSPGSHAYSASRLGSGEIWWWKRGREQTVHGGARASRGRQKRRPRGRPEIERGKGGPRSGLRCLPPQGRAKGGVEQRE